MAGEIERRGEPTARLDIELAATSLPNLRNRPLKRLGIQSHAVADSSKIGEVEDRRSELGDGPRRRRPVTEHKQPIYGVALPRYDENKSDGPGEREESAVRQ